MPFKILIVRFSSIGDIVMTTPAIRAAKRQVNGGDVEVHVLTKRGHASVLAHNPYIDRLHLIDREVGEVLESLKAERFDFVADLHHNLRSGQVVRAMDCPAGRVAKYTLRRWLFIHMGIACMPPLHVVQRNLAVLAPLGVQDDGEGLDYFIGPEDEVDPAFLPESHRTGGYVAVVIGGQHIGKLYPAEKIGSVCRLLGMPVVLLGGPEDVDRGDEIAAQGGDLVFNACGRISFNRSAALVRDAECVVSNDTGLMHVAAAFKKKVISLWGATVPELGMYPFRPGEGSQMLEAQCPGRPYSKHGKTLPLRAPYTCWDGVAAEKVVAAIRG